MQSKWVVCRIGYEYDDQIEQKLDCSSPSRIYDSREEADKAAKEMTALQYDDLDPGAYGYSISDISYYEEDELVERLRGLNALETPKHRWRSNYKIKRGLTPEVLREVAKLFSIEFFEVVEVPYYG
jgi:hypothetical protein